ncbi:MAG TPA: SAM-dependent methyltransferase [Verrucomicrobiales bacterium]|nr:SAM-dependent methyltransferase [Verrucomicrobiales bacterium]
MSPIEFIHQHFIHDRRVRRLSEWFAGWLPPGSSVLDVGTGDGRLARAILDLRPGLTLQGLETAPRVGCAIPVRPFDGCSLPVGDRSVDVVLFCDVLHHADDPLALLREAARVARAFVLIKDHLREGWLAQATLRFMDDTGNRRHGVPIPANYLNTREWTVAFADAGLRLVHRETRLRLYPIPFDWWFGRSLHFLARLEPIR